MEKIKHFTESEKGKDILTVIIVILVGLGCFGIGRLSKENLSPGIKIEYPNQQANTVNILKPSNTAQSVVSSSISQKNSQNYFASKKGHKYYPTGCSAGKTIKEENKIYFNSSSEAEKAGYELSSSCK